MTHVVDLSLLSFVMHETDLRERTHDSWLKQQHLFLFGSLDFEAEIITMRPIPSRSMATGHN